jgi:hypothetical protein
MSAVWDPLRYLETEPTARKFLSQRYAAVGVEYPERQAFQQSTRFVYLLKQARAFYRAASQADLLIQPLLLFYGCTHLLKAVLLSRDPFYPQNSRMLQHGVTTRKLKKTPYFLLEDEVRPQKEGFFARLAKILALPSMQDRYAVKDLFSAFAELADDYSAVVEQSNWLPINVPPGNEIISFPAVPYGSLAFSAETFLQLLNRLAPDGIRFTKMVQQNDLLPRHADEKTVVFQCAIRSALQQHPLFFRTGSGRYYFWNGSLENLPAVEWASHFLLLYLLGMLCRYETEVWGELVLSHSFAEMYLIERFLAYHQTAFPLLIMELFHKNNTRHEP